MFIVYGIPNCDTVKKARTWLDERGVKYTFHNYKTDGIAPEKVKSWVEQLPWDKVVNKASTTWKELSDEEKSKVTDGVSAIPLVVEKNSVVKRPLIEDENGKVVALGFNVKAYDEIFS